jgi:hypothetical protein
MMRSMLMVVLLKHLRLNMSDCEVPALSPWGPTDAPGNSERPPAATGSGGETTCRSGSTSTACVP